MEQEFAFNYPLNYPEIIAKEIVKFLSPIGDPLLKIFQPAYDYFDVLGESANIKPDILIFLILIFVSLPFAFIHRFLLPNSPALKHLYTASLGLFFAFFSYGYSALITFGTVVLSYLCMLLLPRSFSPKVIIFFILIELFYIHSYRMITDYNSTFHDFSGMHMMMIVRLFLAAMSYSDGGIAEEELHPYRLKASVKKLPNPIEFLGFSFFYPTVLPGPVFDLQHYMEFQKQYGLERLPGCFFQVAKRIILVVFSMIVYAKALPHFSREFFLDGSFYEFTFFKRLWFPVVMIILFTSKYHMIWYLAEASLILAGMGYNGVDPVTKKAKWDKVLQTDMIKFETARNAQELASTWNISMNKAFKTYLYFSSGKNSKPGAFNVFKVFFASAVWHGFYPGYYLFFGLLGWGTFFSKLFQKNFGPFMFAENRNTFLELFISYLFTFIGWITMHVEVYWCAASFVLLSYSDTMKFWSSIYYIPPLLMFGGTIVGFAFNAIMPKYVKKYQKFVMEQNAKKKL